MDWMQILVLMFGNAAIVIPLFLWNRSESNADRRDIMNLISAIKEEMKDFHGRLERLDAEFKCHILEERNRK